MAVGCWNAVMSNLGLALRHRSHNYESDSIVYYHDRDIRGFNMIYTHHDEMLSSQIHPIRIWRQGDFIAHVTHSPTDNIHKRWKHLVEYFEPFRYACPSVYEHSDECYAKPCHEDLWNDDEYKFANLWSDYVPQIPPFELKRNSSMECETFLQVPVKFVYYNGNYVPSLFRTHSTEDIKSRVLDFVQEAADFNFFFDTWSWIEHKLQTSEPFVCMEIGDGLSRAGRFNPAIENTTADFL